MNATYLKTIRWVGLTFALLCFYQGFRAWDKHADAELNSATQISTASRDRSSSIAHNQRQLITRPIRDIVPGMRVLAKNPELAGSDIGQSVIEPQSWRLVRLQIAKPDGGSIEISLLRPRWWLAAHAIESIKQYARFQSQHPFIAEPFSYPQDDKTAIEEYLVGRTINLDLPEMGASGSARVTSIDSCPSLESADGDVDRHVVTGSFRHSAGNVIDLQIEGEADSIGVTENHPFWSENRQAFVAAGSLRVGENLRRADGLRPSLFQSSHCRCGHESMPA